MNPHDEAKRMFHTQERETEKSARGGFSHGIMSDSGLCIDLLVSMKRVCVSASYAT